MTWLLAIALALAALALAAFAFRVVRTGWTAFAAALALGLAGYALQASPGVPGAPSAPAAGGEEGAWALVDERKEMIGGQARSTNDKVLVADALTQPALLAYRRAAELDAGGVGPGYFLGLALIRQGQFGQARSIWAEALDGARDDAAGRGLVAQRLARLDALLRGEGPVSVPQ